MDTKLTLSLDKKVIEQAKKYAKKKNISLSKLIEAYLNKASLKEKEEPNISPLVKSLSGVIKLPKDFNPKKGYTDFLAEKYKIE
jgi:macrodomain Ter protein organizer (MatP/YcbG family)